MINTIRFKESYFIALLLLITLVNTIDIIVDYYDGASLPHILLEMVVIIFSVSGIAYLLIEVRQRLKDLEDMQKHLGVIDKDLSKSREQLKQVGSKFGEIINKQFTTWDLSPSEKEVAMLLLKGLSFEEIAKIRGTKEKTIHQQATSIYRKSSVSGRHEFAAYFYEDFLVLEVT